MSQYHLVSINCHRPSRSVVLFSTPDHDVGRTHSSTSGTTVELEPTYLLLGRPAVSNDSSSGPFFYWSPPASTSKPWDTPNGFPKLFLRETKGDLWLPGPSSGCSKDCSIPPWGPTARPWLVENLARGWPSGGGCLHTSAGMTIGWSKGSPNGHPFRGGPALP